MAAGNFNEIAVKFGADISELQKGIAQVNSLLTAKVAKGFDQAGKGAKVSGASIKAGFRDAAQAVAFLGVALGSQKAEFIVFASTAISAVGTVGKALAAVAGGPITIVIAVLAALGVAIYAAANNWEQFKTITTKVWNIVVSFVAGAIKKIAELLKSIPLIGELFNDFLDTTIKKTGEWKVAADGTVAAIKLQEVATAKATAALKTYNEVLNSGAASVKKIEAEEKLFGVSLETAQAKAAAFKTALIELQTLGVSPLTDEFALVKASYEAASAEAEEFKVVADLEKTTKQVREFKAELSQGSLGIAEALLPEESLQVLTDRQVQIRQGFIEWFEGLRITTDDFLQFTQQAVGQFSQGVGDALASAIVYGENLRKAFTGILKSLVASIISFIAQLVIQQLIYLIASKFFAKSEGSTKVGLYAGTAAAAAAAASVETFGIVGIALAPAFAAAAAAAVVGGALAGYGSGSGAAAGAFGSAATGALVSGPALMLVGEGREKKEIIAPYSKFEAALNSGGGAEQTINVIIGDEVIARANIRGMPRELTIMGVR